MITPLNLPKAKLKLTRRGEQVYVWCIIRNKELVCTPEEWVRQHVIHYLINEKGKPKGLIASEYELKYNGLSKRADIVVFDKSGNPELLVECKATTVRITDEVLNQAAQYNNKLGVKEVVLTNGLDHISCIIDDKDNEIKFNIVWDQNEK